jgi:hypothetical protein
MTTETPTAAQLLRRDLNLLRLHLSLTMEGRALGERITAALRDAGALDDTERRTP